MNITDEEHAEMLWTNSIDGSEMFDDERAAMILLREEVLFLGGGKVETYAGSGEFVDTVTLYVLCNDLFAWGTGDGEHIARREIRGLYDACKADPEWGGTRWCCVHRNEKPQAPVVKLMKDAGAWDDVMEALPDNAYDRWARKWAEERRRKEAAS